MPTGKVYLIPNVLQDDDDALKAIPSYVLSAIKDCRVFFTENEKVARRYFKKLWKEMLIDNYEWYAIHKAEESVKQNFTEHLKNGTNIGIVSDAGCPGIADPGQILIDAAQRIGAKVQPLVGPSSILLALMASGMNGQQFQFNGYLPVENVERKKTLRFLEEDSLKRSCTQIFIETPYRNHSLLNDILTTCKSGTKLCIAVDITAASESIETKNIQQWKKETIDLHKRPAIFLLSAY
ncbi:SAM-dependent methyltransferase [Arachidicoccus ginsenosidimutans]|uniref:SAM-dependent methyltransferase n=1 Tax=Arachidicoccus sp. BS20 TaxID=1850526 RepID=UPI0007F04D30|nr:SAM-dependent methyltransferase [Arachidicoccus sp. BS20]ANI88290.1 SAM-dependent methyltransferase [Arachidicoccus sp. BS20]